MPKVKKKGAPVLQVVEPTKEVMEEFEFKSNYILNNPYFAFKEVVLEDFLDKIFVRPEDKGCWPFEAEQCLAYKKWKTQYENGKQNWIESGKDPDDYSAQIDYSEMPEFRGNPIIFYLAPKLEKGTDKEIRNKKGIVCEPKRVIVLKDTEDAKTLSFDFLQPVQGAYFAILSPVTFLGGNRTLKNAQWCYGIGVDLDYVGKKEMENVIWRMTKVNVGTKGKLETVQLLPEANIITNSGHGLHLYFLFKDPVDVHLEYQRGLLEKLKHGIIETCWRLTDTTKARKMEEIQYQGIIQGYRVPGSMTKFNKPVRSFYNEHSHLFTIRELNGFVYSDTKGWKLTDKEVESLENGTPYNPNRVTLAEAKRRWPDWYHERIELGLPQKKWQSKRTLYDYWVKLILSDKTPITVGHRYYCLRFIAILGRKCGVSKEEVSKTILSQVDRMEKLTKPEDGSNHFLLSDAQAALEAYDDEEMMRTSWKYIKAKSGLSAYIAEEKLKNPKKATRRNGRSQTAHLKRARLLRDMDYPNGEWINRKGREKETYANSKKAWIVAAWRYEHPMSNNKSQCSKDTNIDRKTVRKWWKGVEDLYDITQTHYHWRFGVTPEKVRGLFKQYFSPDYEMSKEEKFDLEERQNSEIVYSPWNDPEVETWFKEEEAALLHDVMEL